MSPDNLQQQAGQKGPFEIPYEEGIWIPVPHFLTIVGTVNIFGFYKIVGNVIFFSILIEGLGGGDTSAAVAGTTYFDGMPRPFFSGGSISADNFGTSLGLGTGCLSWPGQIFPPSWPASQYIEVFGWTFLA